MLELQGLDLYCHIFAAIDLLPLHQLVVQSEVCEINAGTCTAYYAFEMITVVTVSGWVAAHTEGRGDFNVSEFRVISEFHNKLISTC